MTNLYSVSFLPNDWCSAPFLYQVPTESFFVSVYQLFLCMYWRYILHISKVSNIASDCSRTVLGPLTRRLSSGQCKRPLSSLNVSQTAWSLLSLRLWCLRVILASFLHPLTSGKQPSSSIHSVSLFVTLMTEITLCLALSHTVGRIDTIYSLCFRIFFCVISWPMLPKLKLLLTCGSARCHVLTVYQVWINGFLLIILCKFPFLLYIAFYFFFNTIQVGDFPWSWSGMSVERQILRFANFELSCLERGGLDVRICPTEIELWAVPSKKRAPYRRNRCIDNSSSRNFGLSCIAKW